MKSLHARLINMHHVDHNTPSNHTVIIPGDSSSADLCDSDDDAAISTRSVGVGIYGELAIDGFGVIFGHAVCRLQNHEDW